jgi:transposase
MFARKKQNKSGSISVQIVSKYYGGYKVFKTIGSTYSAEQAEVYFKQAKNEIDAIKSQLSLFIEEEDILIESFIDKVSNSQIEVIGPELVFGRIFDYIGYNTITTESLFRHLVITRLIYPGSKLKTIEYLQRYQNLEISVDKIYRFMDTLQSNLKPEVENISFARTKKILGGKIEIVFYDMTTLYFEASDEDDLRKTGFSKDGKHQCPQIYLGLLVGADGYAIGYDIFEGNISEGHTLIPVIQKFEKRFNLNKPVIIADSGLLSKDNIKSLEDNGYKYIIGARIKNETDKIKQEILSVDLSNGKPVKITKAPGTSIIVSYSSSRASRDLKNRTKGLHRLEKNITAGKLTKSKINNRGYNKYLKLDGEIKVTIDMEKFERDNKWDGIKGYTTNTDLDPETVIENYKHLWQIEKAFRISKTDLRIRPIYHHLRKRIEAHICISFVAYVIYMDLERALKESKAEFSVKKASEMTRNIYQIKYTLPKSFKEITKTLKMDENQQKLIEVVNQHF